MRIFKCRVPGSSRGPSDLQSDALPTELSRPLMFSHKQTRRATPTQGWPAARMFAGYQNNPEASNSSLCHTWTRRLEAVLGATMPRSAVV